MNKGVRAPLPSFIIKMKPEAETSMMIAFLREHSQRHIITDLVNVRIEETDKVKITVFVDKDRIKVIPGRYDYFGIGITDDPYSEWADDSAHLGCMKIGIMMKEAEILNTKFLTIICSKENYAKNMTIPDRRLTHL